MRSQKAICNALARHRPRRVALIAASTWEATHIGIAPLVCGLLLANTLRRALREAACKR